MIFENTEVTVKFNPIWPSLNDVVKKIDSEQPAPEPVKHMTVIDGLRAEIAINSSH